jgi:23S rRNA 5-hydroxycytidine C2501 synthase
VADLQNRIELLAPAKTADYGISAVNCGADAVYIGAPSFSARAAAANSVAEIARLAAYAHQYYARVFVAFNTILFDNELDLAQKLIWQLYEAGADAIIIQDMGILKMDLPPIELHASTQTNNYDPGRIQFLEKSGFKRIVLARELTLGQIRAVRRATTVELESFVHGALCVSFSGQCYMSEALGGRSGNRGVCAQPCRRLYDLVDANGQMIEKQKHLLSLKDLNLTDHISDMALAGITSFKIEGRLKDDNYLKNITAHYRMQLDAFLEGHSGFKRASEGVTRFDFTPDPAKTFSRGSSIYFIKGRNPDMVNFDTPKSGGEFVGTVMKSSGKSIEIKNNAVLNNNDGLCYFDQEGKLNGFKVNVADGSRLSVPEPVALSPGTRLYRNYDHAFTEIIRNSRLVRKIPIDISVSGSEDELELAISGDDNAPYCMSFPIERITARQPEKVQQLLKTQMVRSGDTLFEVRNIMVNWPYPSFLTVAQINQIRREFLAAYMIHRLQHRKFNTAKKMWDDVPLPVKTVDFTWNVSNRLSKLFYEGHGAESIEPAVEITRNYAGKRLMTMKHCLKYQLGYCPHEKKHTPSAFAEPLFLVDGNRRFRLEFDCRECRMNLYQIM